MKSRACWILSILFILGACSNSGNPQKPSELIAEDKYINLMIELQLLRSYGENAEVDSASVDSLKTQVFQEYGETLETFRISHRYYQQFPQDQKRRIEKAIEQLKMDQVGEESESERPRPTPNNR